MGLFFYCCLRLFLIGYKLDNEERSYGKNDSERQANENILYKARNQEHYEGYYRNRYGVRYLSRYVVEVVTLTACGGHNRRIGDG